MALSKAAKFAAAYLGKVIDREKDKTTHVEVVVRPCDMREILDAAEKCQAEPAPDATPTDLAGALRELEAVRRALWDQPGDFAGEAYRHALRASSILESLAEPVEAAPDA